MNKATYDLIMRALHDAAEHIKLLYAAEPCWHSEGSIKLNKDAIAALIKEGFDE